MAGFRWVMFGVKKFCGFSLLNQRICCFSSSSFNLFLIIWEAAILSSWSWLHLRTFTSVTPSVQDLYLSIFTVWYEYFYSSKPEYFLHLWPSITVSSHSVLTTTDGVSSEPVFLARCRLYLDPGWTSWEQFTDWLTVSESNSPLLLFTLKLRALTFWRRGRRTRWRPWLPGGRSASHPRRVPHCDGLHFLLLLLLLRPRHLDPLDRAEAKTAGREEDDLSPPGCAAARSPTVDENRLFIRTDRWIYLDQFCGIGLVQLVWLD